jgi:non-homologous end joining protein Ku
LKETTEAHAYGPQAFAAIRDAMKVGQREGGPRADYFCKPRTHSCDQPWGKGMLGTTHRYDYEVREKFF